MAVHHLTIKIEEEDFARKNALGEIKDYMGELHVDIGEHTVVIELGFGLQHMLKIAEDLRAVNRVAALSKTKSFGDKVAETVAEIEALNREETSDKP